MLLDAIGGGHPGYHEMAAMTSTAQDSSADSNVWNTQGPSANHGSINFNFHVNNDNFTSPVGLNNVKGKESKHLDILLKQNNFLKTIISQIAPSIIPEAAVPASRRKRAAEEVTTPRSLRWTSIPYEKKKRNPLPRIKCFRPSPLCSVRGGFNRQRTTTTTPRPFLPIPLLRKIQRPGDCVLNYFSDILKAFKGFENSSKLKKLVTRSVLGK